MKVRHFGVFTGIDGQVLNSESVSETETICYDPITGILRVGSVGLEVSTLN